MFRRVFFAFIISSILLFSFGLAILPTENPQWLSVNWDKQTVDAGDNVTLMACWNTTVLPVHAAVLKISYDDKTYEAVDISPDWFVPSAEPPCNMSQFEFDTTGYFGTIYWGIEGIYIGVPANVTNFTAYPPGKAGIIGITDRESPTWSNQKQEKDEIAPGETNNLSAKFSDNIGIASASLWTNETGDWEEKQTLDFVEEYAHAAAEDLVSEGALSGTSADITSDADCDSITGCMYQAQGFVPSEPKLAGVDVKLTKSATPLGNLILEIYPDNATGYPDMTGEALTNASMWAGDITEQKFYYFDLPDVELEEDALYHMVLRGSRDTNVGVFMSENSYADSNSSNSKDGGSTWKSYASDWNFITYYVKEVPKIFPKEVDAEFEWSNGEGKVSWKISARDVSDRENETDIMTFSVKAACPTCPDCTEWGDCEQVEAGRREGTRQRICYNCSAETGYVCKPYTKTENCTLAFIKEDADAALAAAEAAINLSKEQNLNTTEAEFLLAEARAAHANSEWEEAVTKANAAKAAAEGAEPLPVPGIGIEIIIIIIVVLLAAVLGVLFLTGKIKLKRKPKERKCVVCGKKLTDGFKCKECKKDVCFDDARTMEGEVYCTNCLKKKGVL